MNTKDPLDQKLIRSLWFAIGATVLLLVVMALTSCSAKMDDVGDYTLDGAPAQKKPVKKNTPKNKISTTFGY